MVTNEQFLYANLLNLAANLDIPWYGPILVLLLKHSVHPSPLFDVALHEHLQPAPWERPVCLY
jgi:hypothetical protein